MRPPEDLGLETVPSREETWRTDGADRRWCAAIARLSDRVEIRGLEAQPLTELAEHELGVSLAGTIAACEITDLAGKTITAASVYAPWERPVPRTKSSWIYSDASVHRLISDLSALIATERGHKLLVAGDLNSLYGYGEGGNEYWRDRYATIFTRMEAIGLSFVGPQHPHGRQADPWPDELPADSKNVPTYHTNRTSPATATRQLDFVFASKSLAPDVAVGARNAPEEWGPSDHCRIEIEVS